MGQLGSLVFAVLISGSCCASLSWVDLSVVNLRSRWFAGTAYANGKLYVFGGQGVSSTLNDSGILGDTWRVDVTAPGGSWMSLSPESGPSPRYGFVGGVVDNYWIISHGCDFQECFSDTWFLDTSAVTPQWQLLINSTEGVPEARFTVAGGVYPGSDQLWLSMGETKFGRKLSDTWLLQINSTGDGITGSWMEVSAGGGLNQYNPFIPHARSVHAGAPINTSTFAIFGGCASGGQVGGPCPLQDSWLLDLDSAEWTSFSICPLPAVRSNMVVVPNRPGQAFILNGGHNYLPGVFPQLIIPLNESEVAGEIYIMRTGKKEGNATDWKRVVVTGTFPDQREGASIAIDATNGAVYLFGGRSIVNSVLRADVWRLEGDGDTDVDEGCPSPILTYVHLHGIFMYVAWGLALPLGVLLGRYYRWTWPCWFIFHIILQSLSVLLTVTGFVLIFLVGSFDSPNFPHAIVGIVLTFLLIQQFLSGIFHPCVNKENGKTPYEEKSGCRKCWEVYHGASGFITAILGLGQVMLGVLLVTGPMVVWYVWAGLGCLWILIFILHEIVYICYNLARKVRRKRVY